MPRPSVLLVLSAVVPCVLQAQADSPTSGPLYDELAQMDSVLFDAAFVACDTQRIYTILAEDIEFYHDKNGLQSGGQVRETFQRLTENCPRALGVTRELVPGSLQVYPIKDYGAIQMGVHRFIEQGAATGTVARFVHLWKIMADGGWRLARVLSFDHRADD